MKPHRLFCLLMAFVTAIASAATLTNEDIVKMTGAKLDEAIILTAIENSEPKFDTSTQGLIDLAAAKVPQTLISAMIKRSSAPKAAPAAAPATPAAELMSPSEVILLDGAQVKPMRYLNPQTRAAARGLGFGGFATYAVLRGTRAGERLTNASPSFLVSIPIQAQPESYVTLASFAVRKNNTREVMTGGGYMSYSTGIHPDRIVAIKTEKEADQSKAQKGFVIYKISPASPLKAGEYAMVLYTGEMQGVVGAWFTGAGNSYFDFGVDP